MPRSAMPRRTALSAVVAAAALSGAISCRNAAEPADVGGLPATLEIRGDAAYIAGTIAERRDDRAAGRILVVASGESRVDRAWVTVHPDSTLVWRDGRKATPVDLTVGRSVVVLVRGPELRSYPVQVTGSAILIENPR
jgi:hypothetical protein